MAKTESFTVAHFVTFIGAIFNIVGRNGIAIGEMFVAGSDPFKTFCKKILHQLIFILNFEKAESFHVLSNLINCASEVDVN